MKSLIVALTSLIIAVFFSSSAIAHHWDGGGLPHYHVGNNIHYGHWGYTGYVGHYGGYHVYSGYDPSYYNIVAPAPVYTSAVWVQGHYNRYGAWVPGHWQY